MTITSSTPWGFRAQLARPHDGDSFWVLCDQGFGSRMEVELRLDSVHAPELSQPGGRETTEFTNGWLLGRNARGRTWPLWIEVTKTSTFEPGMRQSFTRYVATVWPYELGVPVMNPDRSYNDSLNFAVTTFLSGHPEWAPGD